MVDRHIGKFIYATIEEEPFLNFVKTSVDKKNAELLDLFPTQFGEEEVLDQVQDDFSYLIGNTQKQSVETKEEVVEEEEAVAATPVVGTEESAVESAEESAEKSAVESVEASAEENAQGNETLFAPEDSEGRQQSFGMDQNEWNGDGLDIPILSSQTSLDSLFNTSYKLTEDPEEEQAQTKEAGKGEWGDYGEDFNQGFRGIAEDTTVFTPVALSEPLSRTLERPLRPPQDTIPKAPPSFEKPTMMEPLKPNVMEALKGNAIEALKSSNQEPWTIENVNPSVWNYPGQVKIVLHTRSDPATRNVPEKVYSTINYLFYLSIPYSALNLTNGVVSAHIMLMDNDTHNLAKDRRSRGTNPTMLRSCSTAMELSGSIYNGRLKVKINPKADLTFHRTRKLFYWRMAIHVNGQQTLTLDSTPFKVLARRPAENRRPIILEDENPRPVRQKMTEANNGFLDQIRNLAKTCQNMDPKDRLSALRLFTEHLGWNFDSMMSQYVMQRFSKT